MSSEIIPPEETPETTRDISRRKLLKMLTAAGLGTSAYLLLPERWTKPVAAGGLLAPHAQTSATPAPTAAPTQTPTPQPPTHTIVSGSAAQDQQTFNLVTSCLISPADPNIPIVATVSSDQPGPLLSPMVMVVHATQTADTDASGVASYVFDPSTFNPFPNCETPELTVVFSFANPSDGTGTYTVTTPWVQPC